MTRLENACDFRETRALLESGTTITLSNRHYSILSPPP